MPDTDTEIVIRKRLHISGLTPAISFDDLFKRFGIFGSVTALDGLGKLDSLGQPRKFAYVTLETTKSQLSRCMNALSGSMWKGTRLRVGEAKPDFRERILLENASQEEEDTRPRKRRRLIHGVHVRYAQDMSLVTPDNVHQHPQWRVTPLGRLIRPMRLRPARPLGPPPDSLNSKNLLPKAKGKRKQRTSRAPPTRVRRQTIDPLRWGSTHLSGVFLDSWQAASVPSTLNTSGGETTEVEEVEILLNADAEQTATDIPASVDDDGDVNTPQPSSGDSPRNLSLRKKVPSGGSSAPRAMSSPHPASASAVSAEHTDLAVETAKTLELLNSMFGEANEDWGGAESVDSDLDLDLDAERVATNRVDPHVPKIRSAQSLPDTMDFEVVPAADRPIAQQEKAKSEKPTVERQAQVETAASRKNDPVRLPTKLKDLFAPREEEGFSLIGHLDLDLELDLDLDMNMGMEESAFPSSAPLPMPVDYHPDPTNAASTSATGADAQLRSTALDTTLPFFFPQNVKRNDGGHQAMTNRAFVTSFKKFARTEEETQIRERWEGVRGELTREWKRRHREAVKSRRRRGGELG